MILNVRKHYEHDQWDDWMMQYVFDIDDSCFELALETAKAVVKKYEDQYTSGIIDDYALLQDWLIEAFKEAGVVYEEKEIEILDCYLY